MDQTTTEVTTQPAPQGAPSDAATKETPNDYNDGPVRFDDLDSVVDGLKTKNAEVEKPKKLKDDTIETEKTAKDGESDKKHNDRAMSKALRKWKAYQGDKQMELADDIMVELKIDGKLEKVPIAEALENIQGHRGWQKKFETLATEKKSFYSERDSMTSNINKVYDMAVTQNNPRGAIEFLAELVGGNPNKVWDDIKSQISSMDRELLELTPEERDAKIRERELEYYRKRDEERYKQQAREKERSALQKRVDSIKEKYGMDNETFVKLYEQIRASGQVSDQELTPEVVGYYYQNVQRNDMIDTAISEAKLDGEDASKARSYLVSALSIAESDGTKFTREDIVDMIGQAFGAKAAKNLSKKIKRSENTNTARPTPRQNREPLFFDDIDEQ